MEAARPTHTVDTSGRMCRIVSKTAIPAQLSLLSHQLILPVVPLLLSDALVIIASERPNASERVAPMLCSLLCKWVADWIPDLSGGAHSGIGALKGLLQQHARTKQYDREPAKTVGPPAVTEPPGLLTYMVMALLGDTESRYSSCATIRFAISSSTGPPMRTILCTPNQMLPNVAYAEQVLSRTRAKHE